MLKNNSQPLSIGYTVPQWLPLARPVPVSKVYLRINLPEFMSLQKDEGHKNKDNQAHDPEGGKYNSTYPATANYKNQMTVLEKQIVIMCEIAEQLIAMNSDLAPDHN